MSLILRIFVFISGVVLILLARNAIINKKMTVKQSLFWIGCGIVIMIFGIIPQMVALVADLFGVEYGPSVIFSVAILFLFYGVFDCYKTNAELISKVQELAMEISLLNNENAKLKEEAMKLNKKNVEKQDNMENRI